MSLFLRKYASDDLRKALEEEDAAYEIAVENGIRFRKEFVGPFPKYNRLFNGDIGKYDDIVLHEDLK